MEAGLESEKSCQTSVAGQIEMGGQLCAATPQRQTFLKTKQLPNDANHHLVLHLHMEDLEPSKGLVLNEVTPNSMSCLTMIQKLWGATTYRHGIFNWDLPTLLLCDT